MFNLPFKDETFNVTVAYSSIEHVTCNYQQWVVEMSRVVKTKGYFTLTTTNRNNIYVVFINFLWKRIKHGNFDKCFPPRQVYELLCNVGLKILKYDACGLYFEYKLFPFEIVNKAVEDFCFMLE